MYSQIAQNKRRTLVLMAGFVVFMAGFAWLLAQALGRPNLVITMTVIAVAYAAISYFVSAKLALALSGAKPISKADAPQLYRIVENLAITAGLPLPKIYIINDPAPNAFATGRDPQHAHVAVTIGLLEVLEDEELEGVVAHELSHVGNYDIRLMAVVIMLVTVVSLISELFLRWSWWGGDDEDSGSPVAAIGALALAILAPIVGILLQLAVSRRREYLADASGALLTRYPVGLARALAKISQHKRPMRHASSATAHLFITNPLAGRGLGRGVAQLFSTHPPIEDRIAKLTAMESSP